MRVEPGCAPLVPPRSGIVVSSKKNTSETLTRPRSQPSRTPNEPHAHTRGNPTHYSTTRTTTLHRETRTRTAPAERIVCDAAHSGRINYQKTRGDTQRQRITTRHAAKKGGDTRQQKRRQQSAAQHACERADEWGRAPPGKRMPAPRALAARNQASDTSV